MKKYIDGIHLERIGDYYPSRTVLKVRGDLMSLQPMASGMVVKKYKRNGIKIVSMSTVTGVKLFDDFIFDQFGIEGFDADQIS